MFPFWDIFCTFAVNSKIDIVPHFKKGDFIIRTTYQNSKNNMDYIFIRSQKKGNEEYGSIRARVRKDGKVYKVSLGITIKEKEWQKYKTLKYTSSAMMASLGIRYGQFAGMLMQIKHSLEESFIPEQASAIVHSIIFSNINNEAVEAPRLEKKNVILLRDYITTYLSDLISGVRTKQGYTKKVSEGYWRNVEALLKNLKNYETTIKRRVNIDEVTMVFQRQFIKYLRDIGHKPNTVTTRLSALRTIMQVAYLEKKTSNIDQQLPDFVPRKEEVDEIHLTPKQIDQMMKLDLSSKEVIDEHIKKAKLNKKETADIPQLFMKAIHYINYTRDIFVVGCLTGQRFSDYRRINKDMLVTIRDQQFLELIQQKTNKRVFIPYDKRVDAILNKYDGKLPYVNTMTFRLHLHLLGKLLGWTKVAVFDSGTNTENKKFYEMLTSHTARRSFATNAYAAGIPLASIIAVTGHSSERSIRTYLRLDAQEKAIIAANEFKGFLQ